MLKGFTLALYKDLTIIAVIFGKLQLWYLRSKAEKSPQFRNINDLIILFMFVCYFLVCDTDCSGDNNFEHLLTDLLTHPSFTSPSFPLSSSLHLSFHYCTPFRIDSETLLLSYDALSFLSKCKRGGGTRDFTPPAIARHAHWQNGDSLSPFVSLSHFLCSSII